MRNRTTDPSRTGSPSTLEFSPFGPAAGESTDWTPFTTRSGAAGTIVKSTSSR